MPKDSLIYDPETLEFRRRDRKAPWHREGSPSWSEEAARPSSADADPDSGLLSDVDEGSDIDPSGLRVEKPEGYVDPTPTRRRRRRRTSSRGSSRGTSTGWRGIMWGVILIMGVLWVYMLYTHGKDKSEGPRPEEIFMFERGEVIDGE